MSEFMFNKHCLCVSCNTPPTSGQSSWSSPLSHHPRANTGHTTFAWAHWHISIKRGTLSLRKPVPALLAFISHFCLKQLDLRNDQVHIDGLAAVL